MIRLLADECFNGEIVRGLLLQNPGFDVVRVQDVGLAGKDDPAILTWAAEHNRILISHDTATIPTFAYARMVAGQTMPGVLVVRNTLPTSAVISDLLLADSCSEPADWNDRVVYLPF